MKKIALKNAARGTAFDYAGQSWILLENDDGRALCLSKDIIETRAFDEGNCNCHPYRPSERGSNENQNGLIRRHLPKGTDLSTISYEETKRIEDWLNNYPRKMFGYLCSEQLFREEIALILAS